MGLINWIFNKNKLLYGKKILIIDPEEIVGPAIKQVLQDTGIIFKTSNILQPQKRYDHFDMVIVSEVYIFHIQDFRRYNRMPDTPFLVSGPDKWPEESLKLAYYLINAGASEFISPPYTKKELAPTIVKYLQADTAIP